MVCGPVCLWVTPPFAERLIDFGEAVAQDLSARAPASCAASTSHPSKVPVSLTLFVPHLRLISSIPTRRISAEACAHEGNACLALDFSVAEGSAGMLCHLLDRHHPTSLGRMKDSLNRLLLDNAVPMLRIDGLDSECEVVMHSTELFMLVHNDGGLLALPTAEFPGAYSVSTWTFIQ